MFSAQGRQQSDPPAGGRASDLLVCQTDEHLERSEGGANTLGFVEGCENDLELWPVLSFVPETFRHLPKVFG